jgi:hypothetical protein
MLLGAPLQASLQPIFEIANQNLSHACLYCYHDSTGLINAGTGDTQFPVFGNFANASVTIPGVSASGSSSGSLWPGM